MENNINLTPDAVKAIQALQHPCGTYQFYRAHLDRLFNYILNNSDEIGMSDNEAMHTLRALNALLSLIHISEPTPILPTSPALRRRSTNPSTTRHQRQRRWRTPSRKHGNPSNRHVTQYSVYSTFQRKWRLWRRSATFLNKLNERW